MLLAAQNEERGEVVGLYDGELSGVILDDIVRSRAVRWALIGKLDPEDTRSAILGTGRSSSAENIDWTISSLAGVVDLDATVVL